MGTWGTLRGLCCACVLSLVIGSAGCIIGSIGGGGGDGDEESQDELDTDTCEPFAQLACVGGDVRAIDSCGEVGELIDECSGADVCSSAYGSCCAAAETSGPTPNLPFALSLYWKHAPGSVLDATVTIERDPGEDFEMGFDLGFWVDGVLYFVAFTNDLPLDAALGTKKGIALTSLGATGLEDVRAAEGIATFNGSEGRVELPLRWEAGHSYRLTLSRAEAGVIGGAPGDWFDLTVAADGNDPIAVGGMVIPRKAADTPVTLPGEILGLYKVLRYTWGDVTQVLLDGEPADYSLLSATMEVLVDLQVDGAGPTSIDVHHGVDGDGVSWRNVDAGIDQAGAVRMAFGQGVASCNAEGEIR